MRYRYQGRECRPVVEIVQDFVPAAGGISMREFFDDPHAFAAAWSKAAAVVEDTFGDRLRLPLQLPHVSYGHLACLGGELEYPEDSDPNVHAFVADLDEGIRLLWENRDIDFTAHPIFRRFVAMWESVQEAFPDRKVPFGGCGVQGPLTSAVLMRGQDFFCDLYDEPEKATQYLSLLTESIIRFRRQVNRMSGLPEISPDGSGIADDMAAMVSPSLWEAFVMPHLTALHQGTTTGSGFFLHCEDLIASHLPFLERLGVTHYQPSVSPRLTLAEIRENTMVPFDWLLYSFHIIDMDYAQIHDWVRQTVEAGVGTVRTQFGRQTWETGKLDRIQAFYDAFQPFAE